MSNKCYCYLVWKPDTTVCIRKCYFFGPLGCQVDVLIYGYMKIFTKVSSGINNGQKEYRYIYWNICR